MTTIQIVRAGPILYTAAWEQHLAENNNIMAYQHKVTDQTTMAQFHLACKHKNLLSTENSRLLSKKRLSAKIPYIYHYNK